MHVQAYLTFNGRCDEALAFYQQAIGAKVGMLMRNKDAPPGSGCDGLDEVWLNKVMHCDFTVGDSQLMGSDGMPGSPPQAMSGCTLSIATSDLEQGRRMFDALADGGNVQMPYQQTFWARGFGMLTDRFGINWMVNCE
ncbi:VOC family protein [Jeongeupia naejangsanensis]|uniref:VOC family protein n=1 Tax=Jeongeupia naejangsanensis TaxID=613195 RepID=A0ABS2BNQ0_9NEIS|nr:VOC family protein [Jeongeupia naejangsanensis]MBM3117255.1 VOC family protein [Jeongeupia naejangsanensis]